MKAEQEKNSPLGASLILAGTAIGGGMLALPATAAGIGFPTLCLLMLVTWAVSFHAALLTLHVNLKVAPGASLYTMASLTLGRTGRLLATVSPLVLFYALLAAYITGGASLLQTNIPKIVETAEGLPAPTYSLSFALSGGVLVYWSTRLVDYSNRIIFSLMMISLCIVLYALMPSVELPRLISLPIPQVAALAVLPVLFTSFGFHGSVPSVILYLGPQKKTLTRVLLLGSMIPLLVYLGWLGITLGILPDKTLSSIANSGGDVGALVTALKANSASHFILVTCLEFFAGCALLTSFFGVALGLFDYIRSSLPYRWSNRLLAASLTFVPPLLFANYYPDGFLYALGYAAAALATLAIILPVAMAIKIKINKVSDFSFPGGMLLTTSTLIYGLLVIILQLK
ncbi:amino acid permease [Spongorhabdus nitratireducens]